MAYFLCTAGGNGKGNSVIVTCDSDFSGKTLTCTNGTKTYYKTCPSTSPYTVTFTGLSAGTWTISAEIEGTTYTTTVVVTDITTSLNYGFSWQRWVDSSSRLHSSDYASLAALLVDEEALRELFLEHSCVDYMASTVTVTPDLTTVLNTDLAAKWLNNSDYALDKCYANAAIKTAMDTADKYGYGEWVITDNTTTPPTWGAKGNVPIMTSNTAPYGTASATSALSGHDSYMAFDGNLDTFWESNGGTRLGSYVQYDFANPICPKRVHIVGFKDSNVGSSIFVKFTASKDGTTWEDILVETELPIQADKQQYDINLEVEDYYTSIRAYEYGGTYQGQAYAVFRELQYYGRELSVSVPKMATNTTPYGEASVTNPNPPNFTSDKAFYPFSATSSSSHYMELINLNSGQSKVAYEFTSPTRLKGFWFKNRTSSNARGVKDFKLQAYDGTSWVDISQSLQIPSSTTDAESFFEVDSQIAYKKYALIVLSGYQSGVDEAWIGKVNFYGLDYSEKEFEEGSTKKWLYDHGVELETITPFLNGGTVTKGSDEISIITYPNTNTGIKTLDIDLSNFNTLRWKIGNVLDSGFVTEILTGDTPNSGRISYTIDAFPLTSPYNGGLDISNVVQTAKAMYWNGAPNGSYKSTLTEWWLE